MLYFISELKKGFTILCRKPFLFLADPTFANFI
jgi:hypothetical protein